MKIATLAACPVFGGKLAALDTSKALAIPGVRQVVRLDDAGAVVADHMGAAKQGLAALDIRWDEGPNAKRTSADLLPQREAAAPRSGGGRRSGGHAATPMKGSRRPLEALD